MAKFAYNATGKAGNPVTGSLEAADVQAARWMLLERGLKPDSVTEQSADDGGSATPGFAWLNPANWGRVKSVQIELSLKQIAVMLRSGLTLLAAIETLIEQPPSRAARRLFVRIRDRIEAGSSFADALKEHSVFPKGVIAMINLGEESGNLDAVIQRSAVTMESQRRNRNAMLTALFYPAFTFLFAIAISIYMVVAVIPPMKQALEALGRRLPALTQSLLDVTDFIVRWGPLFGVLVFVVIATFTVLWMWPPGRLAIDRAQLRLPLIGLIVNTGGTALFARSMATLLASGITLVEALRILSTIHSNRYLAAVVETSRNRLLEGATLAGSLQRGRAYTPMMIRMIGVGEASGNLEETLTNVADFHDERLQALIRQLSAMLEPAIVLLVGGLVGYVYIAFFVGLYGAM